MRVDVVQLRNPYAPPAAGRQAAPAFSAPAAITDVVTLSDAVPEKPVVRRAVGCALALLSLVAVGAPALGQAVSTAPQAFESSVVSTAPSDVAGDRLSFTRSHVQVVRGDSAARSRAISLAEQVQPHGTIELEAASFEGSDAQRMADVLARKAAEGVTVDIRVGRVDPAVAKVLGSGVHIGQGSKDLRGGFLSVDGRVLQGSYAWHEGDSASTSVYRSQAPAESPNAWTRVLRNDGSRQETREALLAHIRAARTSIFIEAHGLDDAEVLAALRTARDQGVNVNVLLNHTAGDFTHGFDNLRTAVAFSQPNHEIPFRWYEGRDLSSMTAVFDSQTLLVARGDWGGGQERGTDVLVDDHEIASDVKFDMMMNWQQHGRFDLVRPPDQR